MEMGGATSVAPWSWHTKPLLVGLALAGLACLPAHAAFEVGGGGARASAVGGALTATAPDVDAVWYNAAVNGQARHLQVGTTHALLYPGLEGTLSLNALSATAPLGGGSVQLGLSTLDFPGWHEQVVAVGYGRALHPRLALGGTVRSSGWRTDGLSHRSLSLDLGGTWEMGWVHHSTYVRLGAAVQNINAANVSAGGYGAGETPRGVTIGAAIDVGHRGILIDAERRGGHTTVRLGYETRAASLGGATFRLGANSPLNSGLARELDVGIGHVWERWHFDYAYAYPLALTGLGGIHRLSLAYHGR